MNQVVVGALVQPHAPALAFPQHLNPRFAAGKSGALDDALDIGVAHYGRQLTAGNFPPRTKSTHASPCCSATGLTTSVERRVDKSRVRAAGHSPSDFVRDGHCRAQATTMTAAPPTPRTLTSGPASTRCRVIAFVIARHCTLTTRTARRFSRRVSSRALSYFGFSSP